MTSLRSLLFLALLLPAPWLRAQSADAQVDAQKNGPVIGTWFGDFVLTNPDGKISHDTAVLVVEQAGSVLKGGMGRTIDQLTPWTDGKFDNNRVQFHLDAAGGLDVALDLHAGQLTGAATGKTIRAQLDLKPAPGLLPHQQLLQEITLADQQLFEAFTNCDVTRYAGFLSRDLEFYHDHTGKTGYEYNLKALRDRCAEGIQLRRELATDSFIVDAAPGFGAIEAGTQRFYSRGQDGQEHLDATASFTNVWSKETGSWKLVRIISYNHH
jgi:ketosteroid isomerase-like protein